MSAPLQTLAKSGVPLLLTGRHALVAHGCLRAITDNECECAIAAENEKAITDSLAGDQWSAVYRTPFFAKFRLLSSGTPVIRVLFLDPTTFSQLSDASTAHEFDSVPMRVPSLIHVIAMKLQSIKNEPAREPQDQTDILALLRANAGRWHPNELEAICKRFGPKNTYNRLMLRLAT